jgi:hypothetical protein
MRHSHILIDDRLAFIDFNLAFLVILSFFLSLFGYEIFQRRLFTFPAEHNLSQSVHHQLGRCVLLSQFCNNYLWLKILLEITSLSLGRAYVSAVESEIWWRVVIKGRCRWLMLGLSSLVKSVRLERGTSIWRRYIIIKINSLLLLHIIRQSLR